jgi:hypothetical protein
MKTHLEILTEAWRGLRKQARLVLERRRLLLKTCGKDGEADPPCSTCKELMGELRLQALTFLEQAQAVREEHHWRLGAEAMTGKAS